MYFFMRFDFMTSKIKPHEEVPRDVVSYVTSFVVFILFS